MKHFSDQFSAPKSRSQSESEPTAVNRALRGKTQSICYQTEVTQIPNHYQSVFFSWKAHFKISVILKLFRVIFPYLHFITAAHTVLHTPLCTESAVSVMGVTQNYCLWHTTKDKIDSLSMRVKILILQSTVLREDGKCVLPCIYIANKTQNIPVIKCWRASESPSNCLYTGQSEAAISLEWSKTWSPQGTALLYEGSEQKGLCGITHEWVKRGQVATLQLTG